MGWIRKNISKILVALALAFLIVIGYIFVPFMGFIIPFAWLIIKTYFFAFPLIFFLIFSIVTFFIFRTARKRDFAQNQTENKPWVMRHTRQLIVLFIAFIGLSFLGVKIMEKSKNELFNQLIEIMVNNVPKSDTSYNRDITSLVCPLVSEEKLNKMMQDTYANKRIRFFDYPYTIAGRKGDVRWKITPKSGDEKNLPPLSALDLIIIINQTDGECDARIRHYPFGA